MKGKRSNVFQHSPDQLTRISYEILIHHIILILETWSGEDDACGSYITHAPNAAQNNNHTEFTRGYFALSYFLHPLIDIWIYWYIHTYIYCKSPRASSAHHPGAPRMPAERNHLRGPPCHLEQGLLGLSFEFGTPSVGSIAFGSLKG